MPFNIQKIVVEFNVESVSNIKHQVIDLYNHVNVQERYNLHISSVSNYGCLKMWKKILKLLNVNYVNNPSPIQYQLIGNVINVKQSNKKFVITLKPLQC
jgi:hypothetical protein